MQTCKGGCHCGRISFEIEIPVDVTVHRCSCSICQQCGFLHLIVTKNRFKLLSGKDDLTEYRFHTGVARHLFCGHCGIKSFYVPRSHPDSFSVNLNCLDLPDAVQVTIEDFDGRNWSKNREKIIQQTGGASSGSTT
jgi:hypothetical protein